MLWGEGGGGRTFDGPRTFFLTLGAPGETEGTTVPALRNLGMRSPGTLMCLESAVPSHTSRSGHI